MPMTEADFRALLADRSLDASGTPDPVTAVHHRIHQRQVRTRSMLAAVAVAAIAIAALGVPSVLSRDRNNNPTTETIDPSFTRPVEPAPTMPTPSPSPPPSATPLPDFATGAPVFAFGGKLLAGGVLHSPAEGDITITFTPTDWNLAIANWCSSGWPSDKVSFVVTTVNGHNLFGGTCGTGFGKLGDVTPGSEEAAWRDLGVELGKPSTFSASIRQGPMTGRLPLDQSSSPQMAAKR
ncbi:MAG: hypothetical protein QOC60_1239, partial [Frankiaceae bacterium]|nr:hypothetical protein [Frankiaceae bacterium]